MGSLGFLLKMTNDKDTNDKGMTNSKLQTQLEHLEVGTYKHGGPIDLVCHNSL